MFVLLFAACVCEKNVCMRALLCCLCTRGNVKVKACFSFSVFPVGQLEGDSPIRADSVVQRLSAVVSDIELSLSLNDCQSALVHSDPSGSLPLSHSNSRAPPGLSLAALAAPRAKHGPPFKPGL